MLKPENFIDLNDFAEKRKRYQIRKLHMLTLYRDSMERRVAALNASIGTLEEQINRADQSDNKLN